MKRSRRRLTDIGVPCPIHIWNPVRTSTHINSSDERQQHPCQSAENAVDTIRFFQRRTFHVTSAKTGPGFLVTPAWPVGPHNRSGMLSIVQWRLGSTNFGPTSPFFEGLKACANIFRARRAGGIGHSCGLRAGAFVRHQAVTRPESASDFARGDFKSSFIDPSGPKNTRTPIAISLNWARQDSNL
jgi:hypothetical protein